MAANKPPKTSPIYEEEVLPSLTNASEEWEVRQLPLEDNVRSVRLWCLSVEKNSKATFYRMKETTRNTKTKLGNDLSKLTWMKRPEFMYGAVATAGVLGLLVAKLRGRRLPGRLLYGSLGAGLVWGGFHISHPENRSQISSQLKLGREEAYSWGKDKCREVYTEVSDRLSNGSSKSSQSKSK